MMRIDLFKTTPDRAGRYRVEFSNGTVMRLYRQTVEDFALYTGKEFTEQEYAALQKAAGEMSAKMRAVRIVSASSVSKKDLEKRLVQKGEDPDQARDAVRWMSDLNLVDDKKTAEGIVARAISKGYGLARAKQMLYEKRIPKEYWAEALDGYPDQLEHIVKYLQTHLEEDSDEKQRRKVMDSLLRKGHSYGVIRRAMSSLSLNTEDFQED